jgi:GNAT superfamily N-acetyltransferase
MDGGITLRRATPADAPAILHHRRAMFTDMHMGTPESIAAAVALFAPYLQRALQDGAYLGWLAETPDGQVVSGGGLIVHEWPAAAREPRPQMRRAYILNVYTEPAFRRRGLARGVMDAILAWCRQAGFCSVALHASAQGRPIYEAMGFRATNEMRLEL